MNEKYPIQIVKTRGEQDLFKKEAIPSGEPAWITDELIEQNCTSILHSLRNLNKDFEDNDSADKLPIVLTAKLNEHATSKKFRGSVRSIFDRKDKRNVIGKSSGNSVFVKIDNAADLALIESNVEERKTKDKLYGVASILEIEKYRPNIDPELVGRVSS